MRKIIFIRKPLTGNIICNTDIIFFRLPNNERIILLTVDEFITNIYSKRHKLNLELFNVFNAGFCWFL